MATRNYKRHSGVSRLGVLLFVLFIVACVWAGSQVFPFYYYYWEIVGLMESQAAKAQEFSDWQIRNTLIKKIRELEIPLQDEDNLKINRFNNKIVIEFEYEEVLLLELDDEHIYEVYVFQFHPHVEHDL